MYTIILKKWLENNGVFTFSRSSGAGGQNVNKVNTKVTVHIDLKSLDFLSVNELQRVRKNLSNRVNNNDQLVLSCEEERSQSKNRSKLIYKAVLIIEKALVVNKKRKPTKPTKASKSRRYDAKKHQSLKKELRKVKDFY